MNGFHCVTCGKTSRYPHHDTECQHCRERFCGQKATAKYCSAYCRNDVKNQTHASGSRLRHERDEARRLAVAAWRLVDQTPGDAPRWLLYALAEKGTRS